MEATGKIKRIFDIFVCSGNFISAAPYKPGINHVFLIRTDENVQYILQKIDPTVYHDIPLLAENKALVCRHIRNKLIKNKINDISRRCMAYYHTPNGNYYYKDHEGFYWMLSHYIRDAIQYETIKTVEMAYECGRGLGFFYEMLSDFDPSLLNNVSSSTNNVHQLTLQLNNAIKNSSPALLESCRNEIAQLEGKEDEMSRLHQLKEDEEIPLRVTLNHIAVRYMLFDNNEHVLCITNLSTLRPDIMPYDFGEAVRNCCAHDGELDISWFESFVMGFRENAGKHMTRKEKKVLAYSCRVMAYLAAIRSLIHHLNGKHSHLEQVKQDIKFLESVNRQYTQINSWF